MINKKIYDVQKSNDGNKQRQNDRKWKRVVQDGWLAKASLRKSCLSLEWQEKATRAYSKELTQQAWVVQTLHILKKGLILTSSREKCLSPWNMLLTMSLCIPGHHGPYQIVYASSVNHGRGLGPCCINLTFGGARNGITKVSHMNTPCLCDQPSTKTLGSKAQVSFTCWQHIIRVVTHHCWGDSGMSVQLHWRGKLKVWILCAFYLCWF